MTEERDEQDGEKVSLQNIYAAFTSLVVSSEEITWTRFYNFLMANSILVLAWATIYASGKDFQPLGKVIVLVAICVLGAASGILWAQLGLRGRDYLDKLNEAGAKLEGWPDSIDEKKPLTIIQAKKVPFDKGLEPSVRAECNKIWPEETTWRDQLSSSRQLLTKGPLAFTGLYSVLL